MSEYDGDDERVSTRLTAVEPLRPELAPSECAASSEREMAMTGNAVDSMPTEIPEMMLVPCPVADASAIFLTGAYL